ncbi:MAG: hypothetical protein ACXQT4_03020 [Methanotrichaceae archaeon]
MADEIVGQDRLQLAPLRLARQGVTEIAPRYDDGQIAILGAKLIGEFIAAKLIKC